MLSDIELRSLKKEDKPYKVFDRDSLYLVVSSAGSLTLRFDYELKGAVRRSLSIAMGVVG